MIMIIFPVGSGDIKWFKKDPQQKPGFFSGYIVNVCSLLNQKF